MVIGNKRLLKCIIFTLVLFIIACGAIFYAKKIYERKVDMKYVEEIVLKKAKDAMGTGCSVYRSMHGGKNKHYKYLIGCINMDGDWAIDYVVDYENKVRILAERRGENAKSLFMLQ